MPDRIVGNCQSGKIVVQPIPEEEQIERQKILKKAEDRATEAENKRLEREQALNDLETADPSQIGKIIAKLLKND